jgi:hypothetical protein
MRRDCFDFLLTAKNASKKVSLHFIGITGCVSLLARRLDPWVGYVIWVFLCYFEGQAWGDCACWATHPTYQVQMNSTATARPSLPLPCYCSPQIAQLKDRELPSPPETWVSHHSLECGHWPSAAWRPGLYRCIQSRHQHLSAIFWSLLPFLTSLALWTSSDVCWDW